MNKRLRPTEDPNSAASKRMDIRMEAFSYFRWNDTHDERLTYREIATLMDGAPGTSKSSLHRLHKAGNCAIQGNFSNRGRSPILNERALLMLTTIVMENRDASVRQINEQFEKRVVAKRLSDPVSDTTMWRIVEPMRRLRLPLTKDKSEAYCQAVMQFIPKLDPPSNTVWCVDDTQLSYFYADTETQGLEVLRGIWFMAFLEARHRTIVGWWLGTSKPKCEDVLETFRDAAIFGPAGKGGGIPTRVHSDQGGCYKTAEVLECYRDLGITPTRSPKRVPVDNGKVERLFGSLKRELKGSFPGWLLQQLKYPSDRCPALPFVKIRELVAGWVHYHNFRKVHGALDATPYNSWVQGIGTSKPVVDVDRVVQAAREWRELKATASGVQINNTLYNGAALTGVRGKVLVKFPVGNPGDSVEVFTLRGDRIGAVPAPTSDPNVRRNRVKQNLLAAKKRTRTHLDCIEEMRSQLGFTTPSPTATPPIPKKYRKSQKPPTSKPPRQEEPALKPQTITPLSFVE